MIETAKFRIADAAIVSICNENQGLDKELLL